jgi:hypothetical protein
MPGTETPVAFIGFNRPRLTAQTFAVIRAARPAKLFLVADGPRAASPEDKTNCADVRRIVQNVDWRCEVKTNFADRNMGCGRRVSTGVSWVFEQVDEAIILEDDCLPHISFLRFCEDLLKRYRHDTRIMHISGDNFQGGTCRGAYSYYVTKYAHVWGWATWRRAWSLYDFDMRSWPGFRDGGGLHSVCDSPDEEAFWKGALDQTYNGLIDTWDHQWTYCCWSRGGLAIGPNTNLVSNIGFGEDGTHCRANGPLANLPAFDIGSITHPPILTRDKVADEYTFDQVYGGAQYRRQRALLGRMRRIVGNATRRVTGRIRPEQGM